MQPTILLVDDDPAMLAFLRAVFHAEYQVETAKNGAEARKLLARKTVDVILTDMYMPDEDGFEVLFYCKRELPEVPVIVLTAAAATPKYDPLSMAERFGAVATLRKPVMPRVLLDTIHDAVRRSEGGGRRFAVRRSDTGFRDELD